MGFCPSLFQLDARFAAHGRFGQPVADLFLEPVKTLGVEAVAGGGPIDNPVDQSGFAQHPEMLADSRLRQRRVAHDFIRDAHIIRRQEFNDLKALRVAERLEHLGQTLFFEGKFESLLHIVILRYGEDSVKLGNPKY